MHYQLVAWLGTLGKEDPVSYGAALQEEKEAEADRHPNPVPEYGWARSIKTVADWMGMKWLEGRALQQQNPWLFNTILQCANAEKDAEPIQMKIAQAEREQESRHNQAAQVPQF